MTHLTWCEDCGDDMHVNGGKACEYCDSEYCYDCIKEHEEYCNKED